MSSFHGPRERKSFSGGGTAGADDAGQGRNQPWRVATIGAFRPRSGSGHGGVNMERTPINTRILSARRTDTISVWIVAILIPLFLIAPALWNGYPLLQWDTGGYLARWYEGYLVPSRSTVFGLYLHLGEGSDFWLDVVLQALVALWIIEATLRTLGVKQRLTLVAICLLLILT